MNKKLALLIGFIALFAMKMSAQDNYKYGLYLGLGFNTITINSDMHYDDSEVITQMDVVGVDTSYSVHYMPVMNAKVETTPSFTIGGFYEIPVGNIVGLQMHLLYNRYGYMMTGIVDVPNITDEFSVEYSYKAIMKMSNISASLLLKFDVMEKNLSFDLGVTPSFCIKMSKDVERGPMHKTVTYNSKNDYNAFNVCGTVGVTYYWLDVFFLSVKANIGLIDVLKVKEPYISPDDASTVLYNYSDTKSRTNSIYATVGYRW